LRCWLAPSPPRRRLDRPRRKDLPPGLGESAAGGTKDEDDRAQLEQSHLAEDVAEASTESNESRHGEQIGVDDALQSD
jgi:hypothetical protein